MVLDHAWTSVVKASATGNGGNGGAAVAKASDDDDSAVAGAGGGERGEHPTTAPSKKPAAWTGNGASVFKPTVVVGEQQAGGLGLNPLAKEFVPVRPARAAGGANAGPHHQRPRGRRSNGQGGRGGRGRRGGHKAGGARDARDGNGGPAAPHRANEDSIRRTVYICDVDQQVTEAQLATVFLDSGPIVDCRVCGDPNSAMRFAFIEFDDEESARRALVKNGVVLGAHPLRVLPSRTAIVPVNGQYLPQSYEEREQCSRTVYAANIDKKVDRTDVRAFFETLCGRVSKLRLLGDYQHATRIAFIEFHKAESAIAALNCSGALLGSLPIRVSPSKTPVRPDPRHQQVEEPAGASQGGEGAPSQSEGSEGSGGEEAAAAAAPPSGAGDVNAA